MIGRLFLLAAFAIMGLPVVKAQTGPRLYNYEPPAGFTEYTKVYVVGRFFGDTQDGSCLIIGGVEVPSDHIPLWSDTMIIARVPAGATTGEIVVTTPYGSDSSTAESDPNESWAFWGGTAGFNSNFTILNPTNPVFPILPSYPEPCGCQFVDGTWYFDDGWGNTAQYTFNQASTPNTDGSWNISGNVDWSYYYGEDGTCSQSLSGILDTNGNLEFLVSATEGCGSYGDAFKILNSGCDRTTANYFYEPDWPGHTWPPPSDFVSQIGDANSGEVLIKGETDIPDTEVVDALNDWMAAPNPDLGSGLTLARTTQKVSLESNPNLNFGGRLVYEHDPETGVDGCWFEDSGVPTRFVSVSGGAWWSDVNSKWGKDLFGLASNYVDIYQNALYNADPDHVLCTITIPQAMYIDSSITIPQNYTTNTLQFLIYDEKVCIIRDPQSEITPFCTPYPAN